MPLAQRSLYTSISIAPVIELEDVSDCESDVYILIRTQQAGSVIKVRAASKAQFDKEF
jgi:sulfur transfer protein SufE